MGAKDLTGGRGKPEMAGHGHPFRHRKTTRSAGKHRGQVPAGLPLQELSSAITAPYAMQIPG